MRTIILATFFLVTGVIHSRAGIYDSTEIVKVVERVCDYGLKLYPSTSDNEWEAGTFYTGVMAAYYATGQKRFLDSANAWATFNNWKLISNGADEICCGQTYCELYMLDPKPENAYKIASLASTCGGYKGEGPWGWCDALFMAPPAIIRLGAATGNSSLFSSVSKGWKATTDGLFDYEAGLIYRDGGYFYPGVQTVRGNKVFWSRGNGWVASAIARILEYLPENDSSRQQYIDQLRIMAGSLSRVQGSDGLWRTSLLDSAEYPQPETSGSAFFCHMIAYGIRMGYLDGATYNPVLLKVWKGLVEKVTPEGRLTYVQGVGDRPVGVDPDNTKSYAIGGFLLAGREMLLQKHKNDTTAPAVIVVNSAAVCNQDIRISWQAGADEESGIGGYEIYRDTIPGAARLLTVVGQVTEYTDTTTREETVYYYRLKAVNGMGLNSAVFSNEVSATTAPDTTKPMIIGVTAFSDSNVQVLFSEPVEAQTAEDAAHYSIGQGITVKTARLAGERGLVLTTSPLTRVMEYTLSVSGVKDRARAGNLILPVDRKFTFYYYYHDFEAGGKLSWQPKTASRWSIVSDNGDNAYCINSGGDGWIGEYSTLQGVTAEEFELSVNVRTAVDRNQEPGIIFGYTDNANFFCIGHYMDGPNVLFRILNGRRTDVLTFNLFQDSDYHHLVVSYYGGAVVISEDGVELGRSVFDNIPAGQVGLYSGSSSAVYFDDFRLTLLSSEYTTVSGGTTPLIEPEISVHPNPFNPSARISYNLPEKAAVTLTLYNPQGKVVRKLTSGMESAGRHMVQVDAGGLSSGIYICELKAGTTAKRLKLVLMR